MVIVHIKEPKMNKELESSGNAVFSLMYHLIIVVKYRQDVFISDAMSEKCREIITRLVHEDGEEVVSIECGIDHVHVLLKTNPSTNLPKLVNIIKGCSSRLLRKEFSTELKDKLWGDSFWSPSYYLATSGNVSLDTLIRYIDNQRKRV